MHHSLCARSARAFILVAVATTGAFSSEHAQMGSADAKYQAAQRSINTAIVTLEAYLRDNPGGKYASVARAQLRALNGLKANSMTVPMVQLSEHYPVFAMYNPGTEWGVTSVSKQSGKTVVTLSVHNVDDNKASYFFDFGDSPLALVDNKGQYYAMLDVTSQRPAGVSIIRPEGPKSGREHPLLWVMQGGQTIQVTVEFEPLAPDATAGKITYKNAAYKKGVVPAPFSLLNRRQAAR